MENESWQATLFPLNFLSFYQNNNTKTIPEKILQFKIFYLLENELYYIFNSLRRMKPKGFVVR